MGYEVVASFVVQKESEEAIAEALYMLKKWNPQWNLTFL